MIIYKYEVEHGERITAPFVKLLDVQEQGDIFVLWAIVDPDGKTEDSTILFNILGTGWPFSGTPGTYVKTVQDFEGLVWHFFVDGPAWLVKTFGKTEEPQIYTDPDFLNNIIKDSISPIVVQELLR